MSLREWEYNGSFGFVYKQMSLLVLSGFSNQSHWYFFPLGKLSAEIIWKSSQKKKKKENHLRVFSRSEVYWLIYENVNFFLSFSLKFLSNVIFILFPHLGTSMKWVGYTENQLLSLSRSFTIKYGQADIDVVMLLSLNFHLGSEIHVSK